MGITEVRKSGIAEEVSYLAFPWKVVLFKSTAIQWNQEIGAAIAVLQWKAGCGHFFSGRCRSYIESVRVSK